MGLLIFRKWVRSYGIVTTRALSVMLCITVLFLILPACQSNQGPAVPSQAIPLPVASSSKSPENDGSPEPEKQVELVYESLEGPLGTLGVYPVETSRIEAVLMEKSSVIVKRVIEAGELGDYLIYVKRNDESQLYVGMEITANGSGSALGEELYEIGYVSEIPYLNDIEITKSNLFGQSSIHIYGACGANCVMNNWIHFEEAVPGVPISDFRLNAHAEEIDIDEDGTPEVIATESSTIAKVMIYKKINDQVHFVDLNITLQAEHPNSVVYKSNQRIFTAIYPNVTRDYQYKPGHDVMVQINEVWIPVEIYDGGKPT